MIPLVFWSFKLQWTGCQVLCECYLHSKRMLPIEAKVLGCYDIVEIWTIIWGLLQYGISADIHIKLESRKIAFAYNLICRYSIVFEILPRPPQWYCHRILCKISKRLDSWTRFYGRRRFREIWVWDEFRTDISYCTAPLIIILCLLRYLVQGNTFM